MQARKVRAISSTARSPLLQAKQGSSLIVRGMSSVPTGSTLVLRRGMAFPRGEREENATHQAPFLTLMQAWHR